MRLKVIGILCFLALTPFSSKAEPPILRISLETPPVTLDWQKIKSPSGRFLVSFLMRGLLKYPSNSTKPQCDLCKTIELSKDQKTLKVTLKKNILWSDDKILNSQHFIDSFERLQTLKKFWKQSIQSIQKKDKLSFEIKLNQKIDNLLDRLTTPETFPIRKENLKGKKGIQMASFATLGPFYLAEWKSNRIVFEGNRNSRKKRPVYRVEFIGGSHKKLLSLFDQGKIDILTSPRTEDIVSHPSAQIQLSPFWATRLLAFNHQKNQDPSLRKAIAYSLDTNLLPSQLKNGERKATGLIPPGIEGHHSKSLFTPDEKKAQSERHRAVIWPKWITLKLLVQDSDTQIKIAETIENSLKKIHISIKTQELSSQKFYQALDQGDYDLAIVTINFETASPMDLLQKFHSKNEGNFFKFSNSSYDQLLKSQTPIPQLLNFLENQELASLPLGYPANAFLLSNRVNSFSVTPFGNPDLTQIDLKK